MFNRNKKDRRNKSNKGFSLVELIVVIAIMAVLVAVLAPQFTKYIDQSRKSNDAATVSGIVTAAQVGIADQEYDTPAGTYTITVGEKGTGTTLDYNSTDLPVGVEGSENMVNAIIDSCGALEQMYRTANAWGGDITIQMVVSSDGDITITYAPQEFADYIERTATTTP